MLREWALSEIDDCIIYLSLSFLHGYSVQFAQSEQLFYEIGLRDIDEIQRRIGKAILWLEICYDNLY